MSYAATRCGEWVLRNEDFIDIEERIESYDSMGISTSRWEQKSVITTKSRRVKDRESEKLIGMPRGSINRPESIPENIVEWMVDQMVFLTGR